MELMEDPVICRGQFRIRLRLHCQPSNVRICLRTSYTVFDPDFGSEGWGFESLQAREL
jgi:hypothetical protein